MEKDTECLSEGPNTANEVGDMITKIIEKHTKKGKTVIKIEIEINHE